MFEERMADLEGAEAARGTASGMAAVFAALACQVKAGDRIVSSDALFGSCQFILADILPKWGVECVFVDGRDNEAWKKALSKPTHGGVPGDAEQSEPAPGRSRDGERAGACGRCDGRRR